MLLDDIDGPSRANAPPYQDVYNLRADRGTGGYDAPHRFVVGCVYQVGTAVSEKRCSRQGRDRRLAERRHYGVPRRSADPGRAELTAWGEYAAPDIAADVDYHF